MAEKKVIRVIGRRKAAVVRLLFKAGSEPCTANGQGLKEYFKNDRHIIEIEKPLKIADRLGQYTFSANLTGGGMTGQAGALRLAVARALCQADAALRPPLKKEGLLTRDPREVERKKYGRAGARRRFQFSKR